MDSGSGCRKRVADKMRQEVLGTEESLTKDILPGRKNGNGGKKRQEMSGTEESLTKDILPGRKNGNGGKKRQEMSGTEESLTKDILPGRKNGNGGKKRQEVLGTEESLTKDILPGRKNGNGGKKRQGVLGTEESLTKVILPGRKNGNGGKKRQGVLGTEESLTKVIPPACKYGSDGDQYAHKNYKYNMDYYHMTELGGRPKMLHEIDLWNISSSNYVGHTVRLKKLNLPRQSTLPTLEDFLENGRFYEASPERLGALLQNECDNDEDNNADDQCWVSLPDDVQVSADYSDEPEMLSEHLSAASGSIENTMNNNADAQCRTSISDDVQVSAAYSNEPEMLPEHLSAASGSIENTMSILSLSLPNPSNEHLSNGQHEERPNCSGKSSKKKRRSSDGF